METKREGSGLDTRTEAEKAREVKSINNKVTASQTTLSSLGMERSMDNIDLSVADNMPGVGGEGCINHYEDLRDPKIPEWENNFLVVRD